MLFVCGSSAYVAVVRDVRLCRLRLPIGQGSFVHIVLKYILYTVVRTGTCIQCPFTGVVEPLGTVGPVQLDNAQGPFVAYLGILLGSQYLFHARQDILPVRGGFVLEELRVPVCIEPVL